MSNNIEFVAPGSMTPVEPTYRAMQLTSATTDAGLVETWLAQHQASEHTLRAYRRAAQLFLESLGVPLRSATLEDARRGFQALALREDGTEASGATTTQRTAAAKSLLSFGKRVGYLPANLGELFKLKAVPTKRAAKIMPESSAWLLLNSAENERDGLLLDVAYYGGLRVSELASLKWGMIVDRENGKAQIAGLVGKGDKEREVLLPDEVAERLRTFRDGAHDNDPVFKGRDLANKRRKRLDGHMSTQAIWAIIKRVAERSRLPENLKSKISPHWLRHAHASHALDNGAPISLVQQTLGHGSIKTTSIYAHAKPGDSSALYLRKAR